MKQLDSAKFVANHWNLLHRGARPKVSLRSQDLILIHLHKMTKNSAIERVHKHPELSVVKDKAPAKLCRDFEQVD